MIASKYVMMDVHSMDVQMLMHVIMIATAGCDDGTCEFTTCAGCTDPTACNYNPSATIDDGVSLRLRMYRYMVLVYDPLL